MMDPRRYYRYVVESKSNREVYSLQEYFCEEAGLVSYEQARAAWSSALSRTDKRLFRLYVHIPFCRSRCRFCMYESDALGRAPVPAACLTHLAACARALSRTFRKMRFSELYVGGGTPSLLTERQMATLFAALAESFTPAPERTFTFEMNPRDVTRGKARLLKQAGCGRVSMGVQSVSPRELAAAGRGGQAFAHVRDAIAVLREEGIEDVNCDLLLGLVGATARSVLEGVSRVAEQEPTSLTLYYLQPQGNLAYLKAGGTDFYAVRGRLERAVERGLCEIAARRRLVLGGNAFGRYMGRAPRGYKTGTSGAPVRPARLAEEAKRWELGLGRYSLSFAGGEFQYQDTSPSFAFDPAAPVLRMKEFSREDRIANLAIQSYCSDGLISQAPVLKHHGVRVTEHFQAGLAVLQASQRARVEDGDIRLLSRTPDELMTDMLVLLDHGRGRVLRRFRDRRGSATPK